ncbi:MAG: peptide deformylase [Rhodoblastus sp.]
MSIKPIICIPDSRLRLVSKPVERVDDDIRRLMDDMLETMYDAPGIGLAAIQIAIPRRVVVIDTAKEGEEARPVCFVNPEVVWSSEEKRVYQEGCLSIPEYYEDVERPARIRARYLDREGRENEIEADGLLATALQHEIDHLNGVLFIDHLSRLKRERVWKKYEKIARRAAAESGHPAHDPREL